MNAIQADTFVNETIARDIPELRPLLGHQVRIIALDMGLGEKDQPEQALDFEQFLATRPQWPKDRPPISLEDMEAGIVQGALGREDV